MHPDIIGRPAGAFKCENLTDKHTGVIYIAYKISRSARFEKPVSILGVALFSVFFVALWKRVDLKLEK
jgi:oligosaccharyltransferase complex subunit alpha (ribophorin I)